jgi:calcium/calmodulin-dependent protein kinase (CaM kinase) II/calcium/calmodulin-dependent protein kinase I
MWAIGVIIYVLLGGYPPFNHEDPQSTIKADIEFHPEYWDQVSDDAKDLIRKLLRKDPLERWSAEEALKHPWMTLDEADLSRNLGTNLEMFQRSHKLRKFKGAVKAVIATQRIRKVLDSFAKAKDTLDQEAVEEEAEAKRKAEALEMEERQRLASEKAEKDARDDASLRAAVQAAREKEEEARKGTKVVRRGNSKGDEHMALMKEKLDTELVKNVHVVDEGSFFDIYDLGDVVRCLLFFIAPQHLPLLFCLDILD